MWQVCYCFQFNLTTFLLRWRKNWVIVFVHVDFDEARSRMAEISFPVFELWSFCWAFDKKTTRQKKHENCPHAVARLIHYRSLQPLTSSFFQGCCQMHPAKNRTEVDVWSNTHLRYEKWWKMIADIFQIINHTKLKETKQRNSTQCCMLLTTLPSSIIWWSDACLSPVSMAFCTCRSAVRSSRRRASKSLDSHSYSRLEAVEPVQPLWQTGLKSN